jgi:hypothetical protein
MIHFAAIGFEDPAHTVKIVNGVCEFFVNVEQDDITPLKSSI